MTRPALRRKKAEIIAFLLGRRTPEERARATRELAEVREQLLASQYKAPAIKLAPMPRRSRFQDMTGQRIGRSVVVRLSPNRLNGAHWILRCDCGQEFEAIGFNLRAAGPRYACPSCRPRAGRPRTPTLCSSCGSADHNRRTCPERSVRYQPGAGIRCLGCAGLPHRRPVTGCRGCGEPYAAEPPVTLAEILAQPRPAPRVFPEGVSLK